MRRSQDLPVDQPRRRFSGRGVLIVLGGLFLFVLIFGRAIARFYVDFLWHDALSRTDVFWGAIGAKATLFVGFFLIFAVLAGVNLFVADRVAPDSFPANVHPYVERFHEIFGRRLRLLRYGVATVFALMLAAPAIGRWQDWLLFRNSQSFGTADEQFGRDVGFYVFELPFLTFVLDWMFAAVIIVLLLTIAAHVLNGGVTLVSPVPVIRAATKTHVGVLLGFLAILKAGDYWLDRFELTNAQTGIVQGATYSVVEARLPALLLLILIAGLTAILYFSVAKTGSFRAPIIASALWLLVSIVGGVVYPAIIQGLVVNPDQESKESEFIARNVAATRQAYGLTEIDVRPIEFDNDEVSAVDVQADIEAIDNVRLLNPNAMRDRFVFDRSDVSELTINDLDVDRQTLDGKDKQVFVAALELDLNGIPNRSWQGLHLLNTRGCGMVLAPAGEVTAGIQRPVYQTVDLERPELYFSQDLTGYAVANSESNERECEEPHVYEGTQGVTLSSFARKAAFSLAFLDYNLLLSGAIQDDSQMLWVRGVNNRLQKLAPFLSYDADPYPVALDGRVNWVVDAYTTTSRYPYSESIGDVDRSRQSGLRSNDNYVRNSVKVVVDGYSGDVAFYAVDDKDPILQAWQSAFPDLFSDLAEAPEGLVEHFRYPEDLFRVQTERYSKYRISPEEFFDRTGAWSIAQAADGSPTADTTTGAPTDGTAIGSASRNTFAVERPTNRFVPYYTYFDTSRPGEPRNEEFVMLRPFVEFSTDNSRTQLQAYMIASSDPDTYGQLTTYVVQPGDDNQLPDGPLLVASDAESTRDISQRISRDSDGGTGVRFGDLQIVPVGQGLLYIRPYYVVQQRTGSRVEETTEFRAVIASFNGRAVLTDTITEALSELFPGFTGELDELAEVDPDDPDAVPADVDEGDVADDRNSEELLLAVNDLLIEAEAALADGDLGEYQDRVDEANDLLLQALTELGIDPDPAIDDADPDATTVDSTTDETSDEEPADG
ncbi:MAG: UPF0182 family protein [Ilumatobacter sp.]|uniref:UPF0182 family protein n=1 Tax=Ilumatobacter sp. TaxID=1967498 RepID=UPI003C7581E6